MTGGTELLGRSPELRRLRALMQEAGDGQQRLVLVGGDPGIGKTSLVSAFAGDAAVEGMNVVWGRCWEGGGAAPFWPWVQVLRACLEHVDDVLLAALGPRAGDVAQLVPEIALRLPGLAPAPASDSPDARLRVFDSVAAFLAATAGQRPLTVILEDVHAADEGSLELLRFLGRRPALVPLLLVATYRLTEVAMSEVHSVAIDALSRCGPVVLLRGLEAEDVGVLLQRAGAPAGTSAVARVQGATDGNPFLVYEAARLLSAAPPGHEGDVVLPTDARQLIARRLDRLPDEDREVLTAAAILGRDFDLGPLGRILNRPADDLVDVLSTAADLAVVEELGLARWSFAHALLREALRDELAPAERARLHRRAGEVLQDLHGPAADGAVVTRIAEHFHAALPLDGGDPAPVVDFCARAATVASEALAHEEAVRWYERALEALERTDAVDEERRYDLLVALAAALRRQGKVDLALDAARRAIRAARAMGSVELGARAAVEAAPLAISDPVVIGALDDALCDLPDEDGPLRARVLVSFAKVLSSSYLTREVILDVSRQGLEMARRVGDPETQWWTFWQWHQTALGGGAGPGGVGTGVLPDELDERRRVADELLDLAARSGDLDRHQLARQLRVANLLDAGDVAGARGEMERRLEDAERLRQPRAVWSATAELANLAVAEGRLEEAEGLIHRAASIGRDLDWVLVDSTVNAQLTALRRHQGKFVELERLANEATETWTVTGFDCRRPIAMLLSLIYRGQREEARAYMDKEVGSGIEHLVGFTTPEGQHVDALRPVCCLTAVAEVCWLLEDRHRAALLYDLALPAAGHHVVTGGPHSRGAADRYLGQLATLLGRFEEAERHFVAGHRLHERMGTPIWGAYGLADHARMLELRDGPGDLSRAMELLTAAAAAFDRLGMDFFAGRARERLDGLTRARAGLRLHQEGEFWAVSFQGTEHRLRDSKGLRYLARLVGTPGAEVHALDLVVGDARASEAVRPPADAGAVLDPEAKAAYRRRLENLRLGPLDADARQEIAFLEAELGAAVGLGGRDRRAASDAERARQSVTKAIRETLDRLGEADPNLGRHLAEAVRTGTYSSYTPG